jgi:hypothetical protein
MMKNEERAAKNSLGEVRACECGGVNVTIGAVTVHVTPDEAEALGDLAIAAVDIVRAAALPKRRRRRPPRTSRLLH